ncbi:FliM/FliN family flagellar motor switch protein [Salipiger sp. P9]|uniref:FliM/FliN family flagellar motor switch protein n=1 Tax=Salipiger pentaromativorans TaxID=2943193 RepID=UPI002157B063|nr:FliM/FliN family flagellar motor switch protein [Salipiger pentaromativorans]MCR8550283.1 FliM/FliN family flagellar motor switch protein [Salipiger pentaromativorans]
MGEPARQDDVLGQKASAARRAFEARAMSPAKALRRALSRTADVLWDLALVTHGVSQEMLDQDGVVERLPANTLLVLLDGPEGALGLAVIDREVMTGVIEVQTLLQVTQMPVEDRPLTQTDAAMTAPLIDGTMERLACYLEGHPLHAQFAGYRFGAMVEDARNAGLLLNAAGYRSYRVAVDLALGRRKGDLVLVLPDRPHAEEAELAAQVAPGTPGPHEQKMKLLPVRMEAVLCTLTLPLRAAQRLQPGDLLPLPPEALDGVAFLAGSGAAVAGGRLGQMNGMRAVRLAWPEGAPRSEQAPEPTERAEPAPLPASPPEVAAPEQAPDLEVSEMSEALPELPPMAFDTGDFSFDAAPMEEEASEDETLDFDFAAAPLDIEES